MPKNEGREFEDKVQKCINSGALWFDKGDLKTKDYLIECKNTNKKSFRISTEILEKLWEEAFNSNKMPKLIIGITNEDSEWLLEVNIIRKRKK